MKRAFLAALLLCGLLPAAVLGASGLSTDITTATVLIANYDATGEFLGWGSGFFVDEEIVVTNRHVMEASAWYRVYATADEAVDFTCYKRVDRDEVYTNPYADVAYVRVDLPCTHGTLEFGEDPPQDRAIVVVGYPYDKSFSGSVALRVGYGNVTGRTEDGWLSTDAWLDVGSSGGPVIDGWNVAGVAVAKGLDEQQRFVEGYFIPSSVILRGLVHAGNVELGYVPKSRSSSSRSSSLSSASSFSSSSRRSVASSQRSVERTTAAFRERTCARVHRWFAKDRKMLDRVNERLMKRFGFTCRG